MAVTELRKTSTKNRDSRNRKITLVAFLRTVLRARDVLTKLLFASSRATKGRREVRDFSLCCEKVIRAIYEALLAHVARRARAVHRVSASCSSLRRSHGLFLFVERCVVTALVRDTETWAPPNAQTLRHFFTASQAHAVVRKLDETRLRVFVRSPIRLWSFGTTLRARMFVRRRTRRLRNVLGCKNNTKSMLANQATRKNSARACFLL
jgi:hypothetical protein